MSDFDYSCSLCDKRLLAVTGVDVKTFIAMAEQADERHICEATS